VHSKSQELSKESVESWDCIISDKFIYGLKPVNSDLEIAVRTGLLDWRSKYHSGDLYLEFYLAFLGQRNSYARGTAVGICRTPCAADVIDANSEINRTNSDNLMLVDIAKLIDLPQGVGFEIWPSRVWLKRFYDFDCIRPYVSNLFIKALGPTFGDDGECGQAAGFCRAEQSELPSKVVKARTDAICEFSNENANGVGDDFLFSAKDVPSMFNIVISPLGIGFALMKRSISSLSWSRCSYARPSFICV